MNNTKIFSCFKECDWIRVVIYIALAYIFSVYARMDWVNWVYSLQNSGALFYNGEIMVNTNDSYIFAKGAKDMLDGSYNKESLIFTGSFLSWLTYLISSLFTSLKFETILLYMSAYFSSLIVVPLILIAKELKFLEAGAIAAFIASVALSYYNRTMAGYYDTDMLTIVLPCFVLWAMIRSTKNDSNIDLLLSSIFILIYGYWYASSYSLNLAMIGTYFAYTLLFQIKRVQNYKATIFMLLAANHNPLFIEIALFALFFVLLCYKKETNLKTMISLALFAIALTIYNGGLAPIVRKLISYIDQNSVQFGIFHFYNVTATIYETELIPFDTFMKRISSAPWVFYLSSAGVLLLFFRKKEMLLALPMLGLGFIALKAGLRFTVYAVPIMALGFGYLLFFIIEMICLFVTKLQELPIVKFILSLALFIPATFFALKPSIAHIKEYRPQTVFVNDEVKVLEELDKIADKKDYTLAWWDYGYPIMYYADTNVLIDGGVHKGSDNFAVSYALTQDQVRSANMARIEVEYLDKERNEKNVSKTPRLERILQDYKIENNNIDLFYSYLGDRNLTLPHKTREIYYYLPYRMFSIFSTVKLFSEIDLSTGKSNTPSFFYETDLFQEKDGLIVTRDFVVGTNANKEYFIQMDKNTIPIEKVIITSYNGTTLNSEVVFSKGSDAPLYLIFMRDYRKMLLLDKKMFNSTFIQLFVLENYDKELFEPVILSPWTKVYKLKR